jgi:hypothetical protein
VPSGGIAHDAAQHEADERPADDHGAHEDHRIDGVVDDPWEQRVDGLAGSRGEQRPDADADEAVPDELDGLALDQPQREQHDGDPDADPEREAQLLGRQPGEGEGDRGQRALEDSAAPAESLGQLGADQLLDGLVHGRRRLPDLP